MNNPYAHRLSHAISETDTICAPATAPGGALAIIRVSGPKALSIVSSVCGGITATTPANTIHFTRITASMPDGSPSGAPVEVIDEALVSIFHAPHSYTGEDSAEIYCHDSQYIINKVLQLLVSNGCRMANPGEYTMRAYLNGKMDLAQAEAVADLIAASNRATHQLAMSQLRGGVSTELGKLREQLLHLTSLLELELDFSDHEDLEFADRKELLLLARQIDNHISRLADSFQQGNALKQGIPVAIVGAPNVGKSTLLNQLLGEERAIVSDIQGTTRDAIEDTITLDGTLFRFIDTAGIRHTSDQIEQMGIERSLAAAHRARIIIMVTEPGVPYPNLEARPDQTIIRIENKTDSFQAKYGIGINELRKRLIAATPKLSDSDIVITNARHHDALCRAHEALLRVLEGLSRNLSGDLLAEDLHEVLTILAEITGGEITPQETLNNIFKHFCVGK